MKKRITLLNIISNIFLQFITILNGFVIPKLILTYFGSNINGLVSSLNQFLSYISLIEGGVTSVVAANLYKPLISKDYKTISSIFNTSADFYKKIGIIYIFYSMLLGCIYPIISNTAYSFEYIFFLTLILSIKLLVQYMFSLTYKTLLNADKKGYILSISQSLLLIFNMAFACISVKLFPSIHVIYLLTGILYILQPVVYGLYIKKHYNIKKDVSKDFKLISQRWNGFAINIAAFIHFSTDISILTIFTNLVTVSVYSVYTLVTNGLRQIIIAISNAIVPTIGQSYAGGNNDEINLKMDLYEFIIFSLVFFFFTVAALLLTPFVMIYTNGITDVNYFHPVFGILILLSEMLYIIKFPHLNLAYSANKFKELTIPCFIEAGLNIIISLVLVRRLGLVGIAIGTLVAMAYRLFFQISFTKKIVDNRKSINFYKKLVIYLIAVGIGLIICYIFIPETNYNFIDFILHGIIYSTLFGTILLITSILFYKREVKYIIKYIKHK